MKLILSVVIAGVTLVSFVRAPRAGVIVFDRVGVDGKTVTLSAETKGTIFAKGGERTEFFLDGKTIGETLSGGDGYAYLEFTPRKKGMEVITAKTKDDEGNGTLLIVERGDSIVFVDVLGSIIENPIILKPRKGSQDALRDIAARFPLVYLVTGIPGEGFMKEWLEDHGYPKSVVLLWNDGKVFSELVEMGVKLKAVIGNASVVGSAKENKPISISFEESEGAKKVKNWEEIPLLIK